AENQGSMSPFPRKLGWFTACIFSAAVSAALILLFREGAPSLATVAVFGVLIAATAQLPVWLRKGMFVSPGLFVCMAAVAVFVAQGSLFGVAVVCAADVSISGLRRDRLGWVPFNAGLSSLSYLAAAAVLAVSHASSITSPPLAVLAMVPCVFAYIA